MAGWMFRGSRAILAVLVVLSLLPILQISEVSAYPAVQIRYYTGSAPSYTFTEYRSSSSFFYSRVNFTNAKDLVISGIQITYKTDGNIPWNGYLQANQSDGTNRQYELTLPATLGQMRSNVINFPGPNYMIVHGNFSMSIFPDSTETEHVYFNSENLTDASHSSYWANDKGWQRLKGYEFMWTARLEELVSFDVGEPGASGTMDAIDTLDCHKVLLVGGTPYTISLDNPDRKSYAVRLYMPDDQLRNPLGEISGKDPSPSFTYAPMKDGFFFLFVEYPGNIGALDYSVKVKTNKMPIPVATGDKVVNVNGTAHFSAEGSSDPDGDPITYSWDFDASDGIQQESNKKSPTWTFRKAGNITITLTIGDGKQTNSTTLKIKVNGLPFGSLSIDGKPITDISARLNLDQNYTFKADFIDPDGDKLTYLWDFGDNTTGSTQTVKHTYADKAVFAYTLNLTVSDPGGKVELTLSLVFNRLPKATVVELKNKPVLGKKIDLTGIGADLDGYIVEYRWDFEGDGTIDAQGNDSTAEHTFAAPGTYNLTLFVVDNDGGIGKDVMPLTFKTKVAPKQDYLPLIAGAVVAVVVVVVLVLILLMRKKKQSPAAPQGPSAAVAPTPPPVTPQQQEQNMYETLYGPKPVPLVEQPPPPPPKPSGPTLVAPPAPAGPKLVPPPAQGTAKLVPPPKPV